MELNQATYYMFRRGNALRGYLIKDIFRKGEIENNPHLVEKTHNSQYIGTEYLKEIVGEVPYNIEYLKTYAPNLYTQFIKGEKSNAERKELAHGIISGILKVDSRGFYFDPKAIRR